MVKRVSAMLLALLFMITVAYAGLPLLQDTGGQQQLKTYIDRVNEFLTEAGESPVNSLFEEYNSFAVLGITEFAQAESPESVEITVRLFADTINSLELRVSDMERFPAIAEAFIRALSSDVADSDTAVRTAREKTKKAQETPDQSFEDEIEELNGTKPYIYYAYYPNEHADGVSWIQMTVIFPMNGITEWDGLGNFVETTKAPDTYSDRSVEYDGYYFSDGYEHYDVYTTPTPEPDSPAGSPYFIP